MRLRTSARAAGALAGGLLLASLTPDLPAQPAAPRVVTATDAGQAPPDQVVIKRQAAQLTPADRYKVAMMLEPFRRIDLAAPADGIVGTVRAMAGEKVAEQTEVAQLDRAELQLVVDRAKANLKAAQIELNQAKGKGDKDTSELAQARFDVAKAELDLANLRLERASLRAPFAGQVFRVPVVERQYVRAGEPIVTIGDTSKLRVEIPVDRTKVKPGDSVELRVEDKTVQGTVENVLPLADRFAPLRELMNSVASASVVIENGSGQHMAGDTVNTSLIPRHPVAEVPNSAIANGMDGTRKVQVVRESVIRDIPVETLGLVGTDHVHVTGAFLADDEIIVSISHPLADGTQIRSAAAGGAASARPRQPGAVGAQRPAESEF